jgi:uncharacterized membrane protein YqaE (UPF0057 family)
LDSQAQTARQLEPAKFWLNILLTIFGYIPGIVHAVWIIAKRSR